jgi:hypothetical protein
MVMERKMIRFVLGGAVLMVFLTFVTIKVFGYEMTQPCPNDGETAYATGNTKLTMTSGCTAVEYKHEGTDYSDFSHPRQFKHVFWATSCDR